MIVHVFNSSQISGPEVLVIPSVALLGEPVLVVNLRETRRSPEEDPLRTYCKRFGVPFESIPVHSRWDPRAAKELRALFFKERPRIIHAHDVKASFYVLHAKVQLPKSLGVKLVSTHHGVFGRPDWKTKLYEYYYRNRILPHFDRSLAVSTEDHETLLRTGIKAEQVRLHLNGVTRRALSPEERLTEQEAVRQAWRLAYPEFDWRGPLLGAIGRLSPEKEHGRLLSILDKLKTLAPELDWRLAVFGKGSEENALIQQCIRLGLSSHVFWAGYRPQLGEELAGFDLLPFPSRAEGLPITLIEAAWARTPVLASPVGGIKDLIPDSEHGGFLDLSRSDEELATEIQQALAQPELLARRAELLQQRVMSQFCQTVWIRRLKEIYRELIPPREPAP